MGLVKIQNVTKEFGAQRILDDVSIEFNTGEIVGLVGANGTGKTTLFRLITGMLQPDVGTVTKSKGLNIGYLTQDPIINPDASLFDEVAESFEELRKLEHRQLELSKQMAETQGDALQTLMAEYDKTHERFLAAGGYTFETRLNEILGGLGFKPTDYDLPMAALSGGQQCRAALAKLLLDDNTFLLLDEPTNHLDIDAVGWLEKYLAGHHGGAIVISHDRYLLDRIADRIVELDQKKLHSFPGSYSNYAKTRDVRRLSQQRQYEQDQEFIAKEREFINKHISTQRTAEAKGRRTRLERRISAGEFVMESPVVTKKMKLSFAESKVPTGWIIDVQDLAKSYGPKRLFSDLTVQVQATQRLGITGPNGTGKSTLLKVILDEVEADAGQIRIDPKSDIGYFAQDGGHLDPDKTVLETLLDTGRFDEQRARSMLGGFRFVNDDVFKKVETLSGGERSRIRLLLLILSAPNALILDEPTNHLDIPSREALESALEDFPGAIVCVSHDRYFLDKISQRLMIIRTDSHQLYQGNYSYYLAQVEEENENRQQAKTGKNGRSKQNRSGKKPSPPTKKRGPYDRKKIEEIEDMITERETRIEAINDAFSDVEVCKDVAKVTTLRVEFDTLKAELAELHTAWEAKIE